MVQKAVHYRAFAFCFGTSVVDASARGVVGGLWGARYQLGSFDGCLSAGETSPVGARYCLASLSVTAGPQPQDPQPRLRHQRRPHGSSPPPQPHSCDGDTRPGLRWDHVSALDPERDAWDALEVNPLSEFFRCQHVMKSTLVMFLLRWVHSGA